MVRHTDALVDRPQSHPDGSVGDCAPQVRPARDTRRGWRADGVRCQLRANAGVADRNTYRRATIRRMHIPAFPVASRRRAEHSSDERRECHRKCAPERDSNGPAPTTSASGACSQRAESREADQ